MVHTLRRFALAFAVTLTARTALAVDTQPTTTPQPTTSHRSYPKMIPQNQQTGEDLVAADMPGYQSHPTVTGTVSCIGSSTVSNLLNRWSDTLKAQSPHITVTVSGLDSGGAPPALLNGTAQLGPMSRPMTDGELAAFTKKFGYPPLRLAVAADAIAIYVEKDNPVAALSLQQIDGMFSRTLHRGGQLLRKWSDVGVTGPLGDLMIARYAIAGDSGTVSVFQEAALAGGSIAVDVTRFRGSSSIVQAVGADDAGIGFASIVLATRRTRAVPLLDAQGLPCAPTYANVLSNKYPLTRFLYIYVNKPPHQDLPAPTRELLTLILSSDGQRVAAAGGNLPLTTALVISQRAALAK